MMLRAGLRAAVLPGAVLVLGAAPEAVSADSLSPVRMQVNVTAVARLDRPLPVTVTVSADPGALDVRSGPLRARVKLAAGECGSGFDQTSGVTLLDGALTPQPDPGEPYQGSASGGGRPAGYGVRTVCVYLQDDYQQFASDTSDLSVKVSQRCTVSADSYDRTAAALAQARRALNRAHGAVARRRVKRMVGQRRIAAAAQESRARTACGAGVTL